MGGHPLGSLYVVATPIGNLEDVSLRALRVLREVSLLAAEDTRTAQKLLARYEIRVPAILSYFEGNSRRRVPQILGYLAEGDVALISEAGTPGISDPGVFLVRAAVEAGYRVVPIPGANAAATALSASGFPGDRFTFLGFLPRRPRERQALLQQVAGHPWPLVLYESPYRVRACLADLLEVLGDRDVAVARELTKLHEEIFRGTLSQALERFLAPRGEFTIVVAPPRVVKERRGTTTPPGGL